MNKQEELKRLKVILKIMESQITDDVYNQQVENQKRKYQKIHQQIKQIEQELSNL